MVENMCHPLRIIDIGMIGVAWFRSGRDLDDLDVFSNVSVKMVPSSEIPQRRSLDLDNSHWIPCFFLGEPLSTSGFHISTYIYIIILYYIILYYIILYYIILYMCI